jgi:predicted RNase H-like HicB family nuclease
LQLLSFGRASDSGVGVHKQVPKDDVMKETYTAVVKQSGPWWIGWIEEIPGVNCQEQTKEELLETLKVTLQEALEFNRREAIEAAGEGFEEAPIAV